MSIHSIRTLLLGLLGVLLATQLPAQGQGQSGTDELVFQDQRGTEYRSLRPGQRIQTFEDQVGSGRLVEGKVVSVGDSSIVVAEKISGQTTEVQLERVRLITFKRDRVIQIISRIFGALGLSGTIIFFVVGLVLWISLIVDPSNIAFFTFALVFLIFLAVWIVTMLAKRWWVRPVFPGLMRWKRRPGGKRRKK